MASALLSPSSSCVKKDYSSLFCLYCNGFDTLIHPSSFSPPLQTSTEMFLFAKQIGSSLKEKVILKEVRLSYRYSQVNALIFLKQSMSMIFSSLSSPAFISTVSQKLGIDALARPRWLRRAAQWGPSAAEEIWLKIGCLSNSKESFSFSIQLLISSLMTIYLCLREQSACQVSLELSFGQLTAHSPMISSSSLFRLSSACSSNSGIFEQSSSTPSSDCFPSYSRLIIRGINKYDL